MVHLMISLNGYFLTNPHTGSGQYTIHLLAHLQDLDVNVAQPAGPLNTVLAGRGDQRARGSAALAVLRPAAAPPHTGRRHHP
jgi:hypothetical protein